MTRQHFNRLAEAGGAIIARIGRASQFPEASAYSAKVAEIVIDELTQACRAFNGGFKPERFADAVRKAIPKS